MFRKHLAENTPAPNDPIRWRGSEVARIEAFSDAVFGFALTLLIVALEVPKNFDQLLLSMRGFFAFGLCFVLLFQVWYFQYKFFRRYGLNDQRTILLNATLLFVVLFYVYPLKFLFNVMVIGNSYVDDGITKVSIRPEQFRELMLIYGAAVVMIYSLLALMYRHASRHRTSLELTEEEEFHTATTMYRHFAVVLVALLSMLVALVLPRATAAMAGMTYILIGPALSILEKRRAKILAARSRREEEDPIAIDAEDPGPVGESI